MKMKIKMNGHKVATRGGFCGSCNNGPPGTPSYNGCSNGSGNKQRTLSASPARRLTHAGNLLSTPSKRARWVEKVLQLREISE